MACNYSTIPASGAASIRELYTTPDQSHPHPVIMGNSISVAEIDYIARLASH